MHAKRTLYLVLAFITLALGTIGIVLPIIPTVPFYMATAFFFAKSSKRLHDWFIATDVYKKHLESFVEKRGMTTKTKLSIISSVTLLMGIGFIMMKNVPIGRIIVAIVWICHIIYFCFGVKTIKESI